MSQSNIFFCVEGAQQTADVFLLVLCLHREKIQKSKLCFISNIGLHLVYPMNTIVAPTNFRYFYNEKQQYSKRGCPTQTSAVREQEGRLATHAATIEHLHARIEARAFLTDC